MKKWLHKIYPFERLQYIHYRKVLFQLKVIVPKSLRGALRFGLDIERAASVPIYRKLDASSRRSILDGTLVPAQKRPSTWELVCERGESCITVKSVCEQPVDKAVGMMISRKWPYTFFLEWIWEYIHYVIPTYYTQSKLGGPGARK